MNFKKAIAIIAHPDDEVGCSGFLDKLRRNGCETSILLTMIREDKRGIENWEFLLKCFKKSCKLLKANCIIPDYLPNEQTDNLVSVIKTIEDHLSNEDLIITHSFSDVHKAHKTIYKAVEVVARPFRKRVNVLTHEMLSASDQGFTSHFLYNYFVPLDKKQIELKKKIMQLYTVELDSTRGPEAIENLAKVRGASCKTKYAEAFHIERMYYETW